jgi:hypothetical protein
MLASRQGEKHRIMQIYRKKHLHFCGKKSKILELTLEQ